MAEFKFFWIPSGGAKARRAGYRRLKIDIEQAWDPDSGRRWGHDFVNTVKSIYMMKSERSDTYNRHYWLHKTEYRLSQVRLVEANEQDDVESLRDFTVEMVTDFTKSYASGISASIFAESPLYRLPCLGS
ncbi:hypothetical protein V1520DRAFT_341745 [Lipomyces starkeyi]|uniref:Uncharacterized protein n=1 Tax=Lipomyces starkeyi NRRL Y-11557 TaxID=675824 RepID=A0A1E3QEN1_LIPST|nr:hypothetical protein LIPSTDRAFT_61506 [Lipomyces starkeyi NRRL Y-11557]